MELRGVPPDEVLD